MGDATGQPAHAFQPLRAQQVCLQFLALRDVRPRAHHLVRLAGGVAQQMHLIVNPHHTAVPAKKAILVDNVFVGQDAAGVDNHAREVFGMHMRAPPMRLQGRLDGVAKQAFKVGAHPRPPQIRTFHPKHRSDVGAGLEDFPQPLLTGPQRLLRPLALGPMAQRADTVREIVGQFGQQFHFRRVESIRLPGIHHQGAKATALVQQRQGDGRSVTAPDRLRAPGSESWIGGNVAGQHRLTGANGRTGGAMTAFGIGPSDVNGVEVTVLETGLGHRAHQPGFILLR